MKKTLPTPPPDFGLGAVCLYDFDGEPKPKKIVGFDLEAHLITRGRSLPRLVVATFAGPGPLPPWILAAREAFPDEVYAYEEQDPYHDVKAWAAAVGRPVAEMALRGMLEWADIITGVNVAFDAATSGANYPALLPAWFAAYHDGRVTDASLRETLLSIATGRLRYDTRLPTAQKTGTANPRYGLAALVMANFGVDLSGDKAKTKDPKEYAERLPYYGSDEPWRLRYALLDGVPVKAWPAKALDYAIEDAAWAWRVVCKQVAPWSGELFSPDDDPIATQVGGVVDEVRQARAAFCLALISAWGPRADEERVRLWETEIDRYVAVAQALGRGNLPAAQEAIQALREAQPEDALREFDETFGGVLALDLFPGQPWLRTVRKKDGSLHKDDGSTDTKVLGARVEEAYRALGKPVPTTETGKVSLKEEVLVESGDPILVAYSACLSAQKMKNQYVPLLWEAVENPFTTYFSALMATGRTSGTDGMQQPPRMGRYRESFKARPGKVFASIDYSQVELCALGQIWLWLFGESDMADAINDGRDLHVLFGIAFAPLDAALTTEGFAPEDIEGRYQRALRAKDDKKDPLHRLVKYSARQWGKSANFSFGGGMGPKAQVVAAKNSYGVVMSEDQAREQKATWAERWSQAPAWFSMAAQATSGPTGTTCVTHWGSGRVREDCDYSTSMNTRFQGLAADGAKLAMFALCCAMYLGPDDPTTQAALRDIGLDAAEFGPLWGVRIWNFIHDEFLYEGDAETAHIWAPLASRIQVAAMRAFIRDVAVEAPAALMTRWLKAADPKFDANGKLVPWDS